MPKLDLTQEQAAAISHRGGALLISAGAGSGKTRVLIERLMGLVAEGRDIDRFLVITYTRAAASELRERLSAAISERLAENPEDAFLRRQASLIYRAQIGTIHSFCSDIIRESAHLVGVKPGFRQLDEQEAEAVLSECLTDLLEARYEDISDNFRTLTDMLSAGRSDDSQLVSVARDTFRAVQSHPDPEAWMLRQIETPVPECGAEKTPWGAFIMDEIKAAASYWLSRMEAELPFLEGSDALAKGWLPSWRETVRSLGECLAALDAGWDSALSFGAVSFPRVNTPRGMGDDPDLTRLKALREGCKKGMEAALGRIEADSAGLMDDMRRLKGVTDELYRLVIDLIRAYAEEKRRRGALDFSDLEHLALKILVGGDGAPTERAQEISRRYDEILVDEYQDVNRVQEMIFTAVSRAGRNMTMVGDVKQSIYRFRLADPSIFLEKYNSYPDAPAPAGEASRILLKHNFRSRPELLDKVNLVFSRLMSPRLGEMPYGEAEIMIPGRPREAESGEDAFELCLCEVPDGEDAPEYEAACAADYILRLIREKGAEPKDVAILLRSFHAKAELFAAALRARGVPCSVSAASVGLFDGWENKLLLEILRLIDNPMQDIPLVGVLKSPVCGFTADELAYIRAAAPGESFYGALCVRARTDERCAAFLSALGELREASAELSAEAVIMLTLEKTGLAALAEAREAGSSERLYLAADYARKCESAGSAGLYSFLRRVDSAAAPKVSSAAPGGVSIMSVHASKGLEFPYVLLCDLSHRFNVQDSQRAVLVHRELGAGAKFRDLARGIEYSSLARTAIAARIRSETLSEELRVMYVAMTRAREKLVCLYSLRDAEKTVNEVRASVSEPPQAEELITKRSMGLWLLSALAGVPGFKYTLLAPEAGAVNLPAAEREEAPDAALCDKIRASLAWSAGGDSAGLPSKLTATALKGSLLALEAAEDAGELPGVGDARRDIMRRPSFVTGSAELTASERGTALHKAMQLVDYAHTGGAAEIAEEIDRMRRMRLISEAEAKAVEPEKLLAFFRSPLGQRALAAQELRREFKFSVLLGAREVYGKGEGEVLLQGVIDLFFKEPDGYVIVDFKSDRIKKAQRAERAAEYAEQLRAYSEALSRITGAKVKESLLYFFECDGRV
jgi:ATP-dependent helicase/nuclease subunit A